MQLKKGASPPLSADGWGGDVAQRCQREHCALKGCNKREWG